jgi:hypothetical protein
MNDQKQLEALKSLAELAKEREGDQQQKIASVRVSPGAYLASASLLTFSAALLLRAGDRRSTTDSMWCCAFSLASALWSPLAVECG